MLQGSIVLGEVEAVSSGPPPSPGIEVPFLVNNNTLATGLAAAGYTVGLFGKYLYVRTWR